MMIAGVSEMWWDEQNRQWRRHPDCTCDREPCVCNWLDPLDEKGQPIKGTVIEKVRENTRKEYERYHAFRLLSSK